MTRRGRRPGNTGAREDILSHARTTFAEMGYDRATIREIARRAKVDPALISHYFGNKESLFTTSLELPINPGDVIEKTIDVGPLDECGARLITTFLEIWDNPQTGPPLLALLRRELSSHNGTDVIREFAVHVILRRLAGKLNASDAPLRANLVGSQLLGIIMGRYVLRIPTLADMPSRKLAAMVAPTLQRYLTGAL